MGCAARFVVGRASSLALGGLCEDARPTIGSLPSIGYNRLMPRQHKPEQDMTEWLDSIGLPRDTTPEAMAKEFEILRRIGPAGRFAMIFELNDNLRSLVQAGVRYRHPHWTDRAVEREVIRLMIGDDLFQRVYGED